MIRTIIISLLMVLMFGCRAHKQEQTEVNVTDDVSTSVSVQSTSARTHHRADSINESWMAAADSVVMVVTADSIVAADGSTIYNARARLHKYNPRTTMSRQTATIDSDTALQTLQSKEVINRASTVNTKQRQEVKPGNNNAAFWAIVICSAIILIYTTISVIRLHARTKT